MREGMRVFLIVVIVLLSVFSGGCIIGSYAFMEMEGYGFESFFTGAIPGFIALAVVIGLISLLRKSKPPAPTDRDDRG